MSLQELIDLFIADVCAGKENETARSYRGKLRYLLAFTGASAPVKRLNPKTIEQFKLSLLNRKTSLRGSRPEKKPLSPFTIKTVLTTIRHFCRWSMRAGYCRKDASASLLIPPAPAPQPKAVSSQMVDALLQAAATTGERRERERDVALIYLLRDTGGRVGGLAGARLTDLDLQRNRLWVIEKGRRRRALHLSPATSAALKAYTSTRLDFHPTGDGLFVGKRGRDLSRGGIYNLLQRLAHRSGLPGRYNPHSFRHAFARDAIDAGADLAHVSQLLGHSSVAVTGMYYARWDDDELHQVHARTSPGRHMPIVEIQND